MSCVVRFECEKADTDNRVGCRSDSLSFEVTTRAAAAPLPSRRRHPTFQFPAAVLQGFVPWARGARAPLALGYAARRTLCARREFEHRALFCLGFDTGLSRGGFSVFEISGQGGPYISNALEEENRKTTQLKQNV